MLRPAERKVRMIIGVVSNLVSFFDNATNKARVALRVYAHQEKRCLYVRSFENIQDLWRPSRIRTVVKSDCDLVLAACALVIQSWELRECDVFGCEITVRVHSELSRTVSAIFINRHDLAVADVGYSVGRFYQFESLSRLII